MKPTSARRAWVGTACITRRSFRPAMRTQSGQFRLCPISPGRATTGTRATCAATGSLLQRATRSSVPTNTQVNFKPASWPPCRKPTMQPIPTIRTGLVLWQVPTQSCSSTSPTRIVHPGNPQSTRIPYSQGRGPVALPIFLFTCPPLTFGYSGSCREPRPRPTQLTRIFLALKSSPGPMTQSVFPSLCATNGGMYSVSATCISNTTLHHPIRA